MASELRVNTLKDASGNNSIATSFVAGGSSKSWMLLNGTGTIALGDSLNITSVTDQGTGHYKPNLTSAFGSTNYSVCGGNNERGVGESNPSTASIMEVICRNSSFNAADANKISATADGDLA
tara:strand:+ start:774 stop:1139 length:366 start_codon:yes stop_codon:yes gene_type:complete